MVSYFEWLCDRDAIRFSGVKNVVLLASMYTNTFSISADANKAIRLDYNRIADALDLRNGYLQGAEYYDPVRPDSKVFPDELPSILEIVLALSYRMSYQLPDEFNDSWCFATIVGNLFKGVDTDNVEDIYERLMIFKNRLYDFNGYGGLFPLKNPKKDQRNVEIWYQMMAYILENF